MRDMTLYLQSLLFLLTVLLACPLSFAQDSVDRKDPNYVRAVLINKITPYIYWPLDTFVTIDESITLCLIENRSDNVGKISDYLNLLATKISGERSYIIKHLNAFTGLSQEDPSECNIIYLTQLNYQLVTQWTNVARESSVLTIADSLEILKQGAMLAFIEERGKMKIYVNTVVLTESAIKIKSSLLRISKKI